MILSKSLDSACLIVAYLRLKKITIAMSLSNLRKAWFWRPIRYVTLFWVFEINFVWFHNDFYHFLRVSWLQRAQLWNQHFNNLKYNICRKLSWCFRILGVVPSQCFFSFCTQVGTYYYVTSEILTCNEHFRGSRSLSREYHVEWVSSSMVWYSSILIWF